MMNSRFPRAPVDTAHCALPRISAAFISHMHLASHLARRFDLCLPRFAGWRIACASSRVADYCKSYPGDITTSRAIICTYTLRFLHGWKSLLCSESDRASWRITRWDFDGLRKDETLMWKINDLRQKRARMDINQTKEFVFCTHSE